MSGATSEIIFNEDSRIFNEGCKKNCTIQRMASIISTIERPSLQPGHKAHELKWPRKCMTTDMRTVLFIDDSIASLNCPGGLGKESLLSTITV